MYHIYNMITDLSALWVSTFLLAGQLVFSLYPSLQALLGAPVAQSGFLCSSHLSWAKANSTVRGLERLYRVHQCIVYMASTERCAGCRTLCWVHGVYIPGAGPASLLIPHLIEQTHWGEYSGLQSFHGQLSGVANCLASGDLGLMVMYSQSRKAKFLLAPPARKRGEHTVLLTFSLRPVLVNRNIM